jgi:hypothetical protein
MFLTRMKSSQVLESRFHADCMSARWLKHLEARPRMAELAVFVEPRGVNGSDRVG